MAIKTTLDSTVSRKTSRSTKNKIKIMSDRSNYSRNKNSYQRIAQKGDQILIILNRNQII
jgi:hypothetical protein